MTLVRSLHRRKYGRPADPKIKVTIARPLPKLFLYHDLEVVKEQWEVFYLYHILPHAGGWQDQPFQWLHDLRQIMSLYDQIPESLEAAGWTVRRSTGKIKNKGISMFGG